MSKRRVDSARSDFPLIGTAEAYGKPLCYLDSAATAQKPRVVIETIEDLYARCNANIHRAVYGMAEEVTARYEQARATVANYIGAGSVSEVVFTSGATASLNVAARSLGELMLQRGDNVVISEMEHHSNIVPWQMVCRAYGAELRAIPIAARGEMGDHSSVIDHRTKIVAVTESSNVLGTMADLSPIVESAHSVGAVVVVDGCQGIVHGNGKGVAESGCDLYAFSGHKLYGANGIGVLWGREELLKKMPPLFGGGEMISSVSIREGSTWAPLPLKFEAGTPNYIGAIALGKAIEYIGEFDRGDIIEHEKLLYNDFEKRLTHTIEGVRVYGRATHKAPICSFTIEGVSSYDLASIIDKYGVAMRSGQLCTQPIMEHYGVETMTRASWAIYNNYGDNDQALQAIESAVKMLRR